MLTLPLREALYEDETFPERELAALVASKVYYHLQEYNESMVFALGAGKLFNLDNGGEYEETIIGTVPRVLLFTMFIPRRLSC